MIVQKDQKDAQKIRFSLKVAKFAGKIRIDLKMNFCINSFFLVRLLVLEIQSILVMIEFKFYKCFTKCFGSFFSKIIFISKDANVMVGVIVFMCLFFCVILSF